MTEAIFAQPGTCIDHTPAAAVAAGVIVQLGDLIGVAKSPIAASALGALAMGGVYDVIKDGTTGPVFALNDPVFYDIVTRLAVRVSGSPGASGVIYLGICVAAAGTNEATVRVKFDEAGTPGFIKDLTWQDLGAGTLTLDVNDIGKVINCTVLTVITVLTAAAEHEFVIRCAADGLLITVSPQGGDKISSPDVTSVNGKDLILAAATSKAGDFIHFQYQAANVWRVTQMRGIWSRET